MSAKTMAQRKLQGEIDRTLKRVKEGCDEFDAILSKVHDAPTANQKEKFEAELKKEIKKLQRLRDQIKSWAGSNEVKQKAPLLEARRVIETKMEAFKETERASKLKAYSTEGLSQQHDEDDDPAGVRAQIGNWLTELNQQAEAFEAEIEQVPPKKRGADPRCLELDYSLERHHFHIEMLERILRAIENEKLDPEAIEDIKDDLEYYIENNSEQDFYEDEDMYDVLNLPEEEVAMAQSAAAATSSLADADESKAAKGASTSKKADTKRKGSKGASSKEDEEAGADGLNTGAGAKLAPGSLIQPGSAPAPVAQPLMPKASTDKTKARSDSKPKPAAKSGMTMAELLGGGKAKPKDGPAPKQAAATSSPAPKEPAQPVPAAVAEPAAGTASPVIPAKQHEPAPAAQVAQPKQPARTMAEMLRNSADREASSKAGEPKAAAKQPAPSAKAAPAAQDKAAAKAAEQKAAAAQAAATAQQQQQQREREEASEREQRERDATAAAAAARAQQQAATVAVAPMGADPASIQAAQVVQQSLSDLQLGGDDDDAAAAAAAAAYGASGADAYGAPPGAGQPPGAIRPAGGVDALHPSAAAGPQRAPLPGQLAPGNPVTGAPLRYLETAMYNLPEAAPRMPASLPGVGYTPTHPVQTPPHYPQVPSAGFNRPAVYRNMEPDSLFFMFYYQQRTYRQILAARELKRQSWRFHKHHLSWFQRHDEPREITAEYERGNFIFFDFEQGWCRRVKQDFVFEFKHLEDEV